MNFIKKYLSGLILLFVFLSQQSLLSQMTLKEKTVDVFTRKKQIIVLNNRLDSLQIMSNEKDSLIGFQELNFQSLSIDYSYLELKKDSVIKSENSIKRYNEKLSLSLDSLKKVNKESKQYSLEQREADSIRYHLLLHKLSEKNKFVVDSLRKVQEVRRDKQEPARIENYYFKDLKSVITGTPDTKNRFTWTFELFKKDSSGYVPIENKAVFNDKSDSLLSVINERIKSDFDRAYKLDKECFTAGEAPIFTFNKLGLEFRDGKVNFYAVFDFATENCYYLYGYTVVEFDIVDIVDYLK